MTSRQFVFVGGDLGRWRVARMETIGGEPLMDVPSVDVIGGPNPLRPAGAKWMLRGIKSNERYVTLAEKERLVAKQPRLDRREATCAALIPIRKTAAWWNLAQDDRRRIFEERSRHVATGLKYLPAVARRLHHCRDLGENEPFDFLTWFEYAPSDAGAFDRMVAELRATDEWAYVDREIDIRLTRELG